MLKNGLLASFNKASAAWKEEKKKFCKQKETAENNPDKMRSKEAK